jgi:hypothetical protein
METSVISPAKAEKALKKRKLGLPDDLVVAISSGNTLASADDPRPEVMLLGKQLLLPFLNFNKGKSCPI